ncbi:hypothetical protein PIB30_034714, partial [Stylosanthes scabra]|nr:hypothetical protein [Stylosanthes scabra]
ICPEFQQSCDIQEKEVYTDSVNEDLAESVSKSNQQTQQEENNAILNQISEIQHFQIHINNSISRNSNIQCSKQKNPESETSDPEIQVLTQSDTKPKSSADNFKFNQNSISVSIIATPTEASNYNGFPEITKKSDEEVTIVPCGQWSKSVMEIGGCLRSARKEGGEEELWVPLVESSRPWMTKWGQNGKVATGAEDDIAAKGRIEAAALKPEAEAVATCPPPTPPNTEPAVIQAAVMPYTEERVQRPPPKPPHLNPYTAALGDSSTAKILVAGRIGAMDDGGKQDTSNNVVSAEEMQTWVTAVVEGELTTGVEAGASGKEKRRTIVAGVDATMTEGGFRARQLRRYLSLNPPPLLATVPPWDRDRSKTREAGGGTMDDGLDKMMTGGLLADETQKTVIHTVRTHEGGALHGGAAQWLVGRSDVPAGVGDGFQCASLLFKIEEMKIREMLNPNFELGSKVVVQAQFQYLLSKLIIGSNLTEIYLEKLVGSIFFKQWDPGGPLCYWQ